MFNRIVMTLTLTALLAAGGMSCVRAQQPTGPGLQATTSSGLSFDLTPYVWFASINTKLNFDLPPALGGTVTADPSIGFGDLISHINIGAMGAADVRYERFSVLTDILYVNVGGVAGQFKSVNFPNHPAIPISGERNTSESLRLGSGVWTLAGGYTLAQGAWGNFDLIAGFRDFWANARVNYSLGFTITGPRGNGATFGGVGGVSTSGDLWNGIGGFRGRIRIGNTAFFIPYYFDIGAGGSNLTWQIASGAGYHLGLADVSLTYRYLTFEQSSSSHVQNLSFKGPVIAANFAF